MTAGTPLLQDVLANVCRGRVAYLALTPEEAGAARSRGADCARRAPAPARSSADEPRTLSRWPRTLSRRSRAGSDTFSVRSVAGAWCGGCARWASLACAASTGSPTETRPSALASVYASISSAGGCALRASRSESVLSASTRLSRGIFGLGGGSIRLRRPPGPAAPRDTCRAAARDEDARRGSPVAAMTAAQTRATADAWGTFQVVNASRPSRSAPRRKP